MRNHSSSDMIEDIWMNTQVALDDIDNHDRIDPNGPDSPVNWEEVEETNVLLNPDSSSMEGRG